METPSLELLPVSFTGLEIKQDTNVSEEAQIRGEVIFTNFTLDIVNSPPYRLNVAGLVTQGDVLTMVVFASGLVVESST